VPVSVLINYSPGIGHFRHHNLRRAGYRTRPLIQHQSCRQARIQGVVILQAIVDSLGNVGYVKVLKGLPEGLTESAVQVVQEWRYEPATLHGEPVPVYINLTVNFSLQ